MLSSAIQIWLPLGGPASRVIFGLIGLVGVGNAARLAWSLRTQAALVLGKSITIRRWPSLLLLGLFGIGLALSANFALAEPMDGDAGLYRIGAILYAQEYSLPPGLANLHSRFGFNSSLWPFAALMGSGIWEGMGFRLVTGLFISVLFWSMVARIGLTRRRGPLPGDWFSILGGAFVAAIVFTDSGRWLPSPAQDLVLLIVGIGSTAYLLDYLVRRTCQESAAMALLLAAFAGTIRPLGWVLFAATLVTLAATLLRSHTQIAGLWARVWRPTARPVVISVVFLFVMLIRDLLLSGWLLYPLTYAPVPVDWRAPDPTAVRNWITWYARAPGADGLSAQDGSWFRPWVESIWASREISVSRWMLGASLLPLLWRKGRRAWRYSWHTIALGAAPAFAVAITWFITAPDVRFGWLGFIGVAAVPLSVLLYAGAYPYWVARVAGVLLLVLLLFTQVLNSRVFPRGAETQPTDLGNGLLSLTVYLAPPQTPITSVGSLSDGTPVTHPTQDGNCWAQFPLCILPGSGAGIERRGPQLSDGFRGAD